MNIKALLLGSAAAFVAVTGAKAADAPVTMVEPEPVEYVRVCDVYGTGFFYIPGTETCLKIGGYIRERLNASSDVGGIADNFNGDNGTRSPDLDDNDREYDFNTQIRARLEIDAREETELGTLRAWTRLQATNIGGGSNQGYGTSDNEVAIDQAFIQLGGLTVGKLDSLWAEEDGLYTDNDWSVGDLSNNQVRYTFATNGFTVSGSIEDDGDGDGVPDGVVQVGYQFAYGSAYVSAVYDEDAVSPNLSYLDNLNLGTFVDPVTGAVLPLTDARDPFYDNNSNGKRDNGAFAFKAGVELKDLITAGSAVKIEGHYATDPTEYASLAPGGYLLGIEAEGNANSVQNFSFVSIPEEWQIGAGYQQSFGKLTAYVSGVYGQSFSIDYANLTGIDSSEKADIWGVAGNLGYQLTSNLTTLAEVSYRKVDLAGGLDDADQTRGFLELRRDF
ncbi:porin [Aureimonas leprariae]|uniref:Porin n=1 Tax=Plantimonas leprariae TaxID=2615207 RepID=A0A7V7TWS6_9HYPH|nr:porin [Aureimonas leprariae]KAB0679915.1 porin [Aureimonas leprariae]